MSSTDLLTGWGYRLTCARNAAGLSISELARQTGIHKSHLARFENGEAGLGDEYRILVAAKVGQSVSELFPYPDTTTENACLSAADAPDAAPSRTPATKAARRSPAPNATAQDASAHAGSHGSERRPA